jgi:hypothetical protein
MAVDTQHGDPDREPDDLESRPSTTPVAGHVAMLPPNQPGLRRGWLVTVVAVVIVVAVFATLSRSPSMTGSVSVSATAEAVASTVTATPAVATPSAPSARQTIAPAPAWAANLVGQLDCDGIPAPIGGEVGEVYPEGGSADSPEAAVEAFVAIALYAGLPVNGWERTHEEDHWARFAHRSAGETKALLVFRDEGPDITSGIWSIAALVACDAAEFAPGSGFTGGLLAVWLDAAGKRVPTTIIHEIAGPGHCDWETTIWLHIEGDLFLRDPDGVLAGATVGTFDPDVALPPDAESTGYHEGDRTIWRDGDPDAIYVVLPDRVERWPRAIEELGCM